MLPSDCGRRAGRLTRRVCFLRPGQRNVCGRRARFGSISRWRGPTLASYGCTCSLDDFETLNHPELELFVQLGGAPGPKGYMGRAFREALSTACMSIEFKQKAPSR
jgi:hypothetical protein